MNRGPFLIIAALYFSTALADPCITLRNLPLEKDFNAMMAELKPSPTSYDRLYDCWKNPHMARPFSSLERNVLGSVEDRMTKPLSIQERIDLYRGLESFEQDLKQVDLTHFEIAQKNALDRLIGQASKLTDEGSFKVALYQQVASIRTVGDGIVASKISETTSDFLKKEFEIKNPKKIILSHLHTELDKSFEKNVFNEYLKNPAFKIPPPALGFGNMDQAIFSDEFLARHLVENRFQLTPDRMQIALERLAKSTHPEVEQAKSQLILFQKNFKEMKPPGPETLSASDYKRFTEHAERDCALNFMKSLIKN